MSRKIRLTRIIGKTGEVAHNLTKMHFSGFHPIDGWAPDVNVYCYDDRFEVWVDLAGVSRNSISVDVLSDRVRISGNRKPPAPTRDSSGRCRQVLCMEIESGRFGREIILPFELDRHRVSAKQENGLLWIVLPLVCPRD